MELLQLLDGMRRGFLAAVLAGAVLLVGLVVWLNGSVGAFASAAAAWVACAGASTLSLFMLGARWNATIRRLVLRPEASMPHVTLGLDFVGWASAVLAIGLLATALALVRPGA